MLYQGKKKKKKTKKGSMLYAAATAVRPDLAFALSGTV
jgi:hypothetical protein